MKTALIALTLALATSTSFAQGKSFQDSLPLVERGQLVNGAPKPAPATTSPAMQVVNKVVSFPVLPTVISTPKGPVPGIKYSKTTP